MFGLILAMLVSATTFRFLADLELLPSLVNYIPELLSIIAAVYVVIVGLQQRFKYFDPTFLLVLLCLAIGVICGAIVNHLQPGPMFAGLRTYLRAVPFFLLPAVLLITERNLKVQLSILLGIAVLQLPVALQQRFATDEVARRRGLLDATGDNTFGTIMNAGLMSVFLISAVCVLAGLYLRRRISTPRFLLLLLLIFVPSTINETKAVAVLLPVALLTTFYVGSARGARLKYLVLSTLFMAGLAAIFVPIYDHYMKERWDYSIVDFFMGRGTEDVTGYLSMGTGVGDVDRPAGRLDGIVAGFNELSKDPTRLFFGFGIGNASDSALGPQFNGEYYSLFAHMRISSFTYVLLEHGILGVALVLFFHALVFRECLRIASTDSTLVGALAVGWAGVSVTMVMSLVYHNPIENVALSYLFWYFSGVLVAHRWRERINARDRSGT